MINTITINSATCSAVLSPLWQYDYGQYLKIEGIDLPASFEVDFATIDQSSSVTMLGEDGQVKVPDDMLDEGVDITAYIYLHSDETDGYTEYVIQIPVLSRPDRTEETPTPQEQTLIEQAITVLNHAVEQTGEDVEAAQQAAEDAEAAAQTATEASETATDAATSASTSATAAAISAGAAATSATQAGLSANSAAASATSSAQSASDAQSAVASIGDSVTRAESAASTATSAAQTASAKAAEANTSAGVAASNATTATVKAQEAAQSATQAAQSATAAQTAQTAAEAAQTGAETAQTAAESAAASAEAEADRAEGYADRLIDVYPTDTASGTIASFPDGADDVEVKSATVQIVPKQAGTGDPSPDNVRPITGWGAVTVTGAGVNVWDEVTKPGTFDNSTGVYNPNRTDILCTNTPIKVNPSTGYYVVFPQVVTGGNVYFYDKDMAFISMTYNNANRVVTTPSGCAYINISFGTLYGTTYNNDISINYPATDTSYHAYSGTTYPLTLPSTVYGGTLTYEGDGVWTVNSRPYYASYAGQTLVGPWVSSMDAYTPGGTPTTGAQVVDLGGTVTEYTVTTDELLTLLGQNCIWADCGDISVTYRADIGLFIDKKLAALAAALS